MNLPVARAANHALARLVSGLAWTWRIEEHHPERLRAVRAGAGPVLYLMWHESLLPLLWCHRDADVAIVVSDARDGLYLTDTARRFGFRPIRGSSSRGAIKALRGVLRQLRQGDEVAMTPDGPRGPRRTVKIGGLAAAQRAQALVMPVFADARPAWRLRSWDRFLIPKPFARVRIGYGDPFRVPAGDDEPRRAAERVEAQMRDLEKEIGWLDAAARTG